MIAEELENTTSRPHAVLLQQGDAWLLFHNPRSIIRADALADVPAALREVEAAVDNGLYAAGFLSYEASPAFDAALVTRAAGTLPLLWFGLYDQPRPCGLPPEADGAYAVSEWTPSVTREAYDRAVTRIRDYIAAGDTYQVNYTWRLRADFQGSAWAYFRALCRSQRVPYRAYLDLGDHALLSFSPELFFTLSGSEVICRPMKGTAPRGRDRQEDRAQAEWLRGSVKNRAENVMIVDMIRNDLGHVARTGSVETASLYDIERYDTLFQMTSTVKAETDAPVADVFRALFPCASITGAPKVRTAEIIAELEDSPRGIYTGAIGYLAPGRRASFNVAIRTVHIDRTRGTAEYGTGGGIVWDSTPQGEYEECRAKAQVVLASPPDFSLLETLLWRPARGYYLLRRHLDRLLESAAYFDIPVDKAAVAEQLADAAFDFTGRQRVRLLVSRNGEITIESAPLPGKTRTPWTVALAKTPVDPANRFLYHKTTNRQLYADARAAFPECDDVILWNPRGEITEATIANIVVSLRGELLTPPVASGLLPGVYRAHLLAQGRIKEAIITIDDLHAAEEIYLINSVRGWIPAKLG